MFHGPFFGIFDTSLITIFIIKQRLFVRKFLILIALTFSFNAYSKEESGDSVIYENSIALDIIPFYYTGLVIYLLK